MDTLTDREKGILKLAVTTYQYPAARERQAAEEFGLGGVHYWQEVNRLTDHPAAYAWDPQTVNLLFRRRIHRDRPRLASRIL
ncbi:DUF3263 domain-containing protein [Pseudarthrobacter sp. MEB009]|uniref:DUF3263 domain-containing protein n=1 Tax=Pseudarthrobacter sp. MEB009 TaxID=3040326 RepID=UPI002553E28F|nr:DUF3263 domain-containing protein [Pseudarthrobacter sp. MEB009]